MPHPSSPGPRRQPDRRRCANLPARLPQPGAGIYRSSRDATKPVSHPRHTLGLPRPAGSKPDHESGPPATDDPSAPSEPSGDLRDLSSRFSRALERRFEPTTVRFPCPSLNPGLAPGERLRLQLDGQTLMTTETPAAVLTRLARGEHTLLVKRLDAGAALAAAERTFTCFAPPWGADLRTLYAPFSALCSQTSTTSNTGNRRKAHILGAGPGLMPPPEKGAKVVQNLLASSRNFWERSRERSTGAEPA